jgi:hypothetical protein
MMVDLKAIPEHVISKLMAQETDSLRNSRKSAHVFLG